MKVGFTAAGFDKAAVLPAGAERIVHEKVSGLPSASEDSEPSRVTRLPVVFVWFGPALAMGAEFDVEIVTESGALLRVPSLTTRLIV